MTRLEKQQEKHNCLWKHGDTLENGNCHRKKIGVGRLLPVNLSYDGNQHPPADWLVTIWRHLWIRRRTQPRSRPTWWPQGPGNIEIWPHGDLTNEIWLVLNQAWKNPDVRHQKRGYTPFLFGQPIMRRWWTFGWNCVSQTKPNYSCCTLDEWNHRWPRVSFRSYAIWEKWFTLPFGEYQFKSGR